MKKPVGMKKVGLLFNEGSAVPLTQTEPDGTLTRFSPRVQDLARRRPPEELLAALGAQLGTRVVARFSSKAGCSMCRCSPGFVLRAEQETEETRRLLGYSRRGDGGYNLHVFHLRDGVVVSHKLRGQPAYKNFGYQLICSLDEKGA